MLDAIWDKSPLRSVIDGLLYEPSKLCDQDRARHALFIGVHLAVGLLALATLPIVILMASDAMGAAASNLSLLPLWMLTPLISVLYLSKTGKLGNAFLLTASMTAAFIIWIASMTGGLQSPHLIWLGVIPLEVALSGNKRIIKRALVICLLALGLIGCIDMTGFLKPAPLTNGGLSLVGALSVMVAILYAGMLAIRIEFLHRGRLCLLQAEEMRYRSIADTVSDMITRHDRSGDVTFASPTAQSPHQCQTRASHGQRAFSESAYSGSPCFSSGFV